MKSRMISSDLGKLFSSLPKDGQAHDLDPALFGMPGGRFPVSTHKDDKQRDAENAQIEAPRLRGMLRHIFAGNLDTAIGMGRTVAMALLKSYRRLSKEIRS